MTQAVERKTPIAMAALRGSIDAFKYLVPFESEENIHLLLRWLCKLDRSEFVDVLMQLHRTSVDSLLINNEDQILQVACRFGALKVAQSLVDKYKFSVSKSDVSIKKGDFCFLN